TLSLTSGVAPNDEVVAEGLFHLEPALRAAPDLVLTLAPLREDAFKTNLNRCGVGREPILIEWLDKPDVIRRQEQALQEPLALLQRNRRQVVAIGIQEIKDVVDDRNGRFHAADVLFTRQIQSGL